MSGSCMLRSVSVFPLNRTFVECKFTLRLDLNLWISAAESADHHILTHCHRKHEFSIRPFIVVQAAYSCSGHRSSTADNGYMPCTVSTMPPSCTRRCALTGALLVKGYAFLKCTHVDKSELSCAIYKLYVGSSPFHEISLSRHICLNGKFKGAHGKTYVSFRYSILFVISNTQFTI